jgi:hypothetical protein
MNIGLLGVSSLLEPALIRIKYLIGVGFLYRIDLLSGGVRGK